MEFHPRIDRSDHPLRESKTILGSFPTWSLTNSDEEDENEKTALRLSNNDFNFFYGSRPNRFWTWYKNYVDDSITVDQTASIRASLKRFDIGITDMITCCERKNRSSLDKHLTNRTYNHSFLRIPSKNESIRILCTSKGVMNDMLLNRLFYQRNTNLKLDFKRSMQVQCEVLSRINGNRLVNKPFYQTINSSQGGQIECFAVPSPGSPFRKLTEFGKLKDDNAEYLNRFLHEAFSWLNSGWSTTRV
jgi:hypothetical protein